MVEFLLIVLAALLLLIGLIGCILPVIPGPPISFVGLLVLEATEKVDFSNNLLLLMFALAAIVTVLDYIIPIWGTKKFGGTRAGVIGSTLGLIFGLIFFPPIGIIIGPFAGAVIGEMIQKDDFNNALKSGIGSFIGFLLGTGMKLVVSSIMIYYFFKEVFA
ncbi:DUF456 domain-containing protein [Salinivirga cyanobacteriivorans]|uniref:DUF456 domain-containing protein n=1 Tax=Salinivirga cyanobacteriivorans TaxID=1307839 RepID=A0A0S2HXF8_9BACT|nr:DUF456 domain-containing protein [Salinivirga cyanobacteriivorans]ALO14728.1 hypothetical protein L21SP5_01062 [Salinivirga cyanobacteriivorans]